jgi:hypothetical protein
MVQLHSGYRLNHWNTDKLNTGTSFVEQIRHWMAETMFPKDTYAGVELHPKVLEKIQILCRFHTKNYKKVIIIAWMVAQRIVRSRTGTLNKAVTQTEQV